MCSAITAASFHLQALLLHYFGRWEWDSLQLKLEFQFNMMVIMVSNQVVQSAHYYFFLHIPPLLYERVL
jgi:hypothetical protein